MPSHPYQSIIDRYHQRGYDRVHVQYEAPGFRYHRHFHPHDLTLEVLQGELEITVETDQRTLKRGESIDIPVGRWHAKCMGADGCAYVHAEKHYLPKHA